MLIIYSTDKIDKCLNYLRSELIKHRLDQTFARIYLYAMFKSKNDNDVIYRPKWSYAISDFEKYLRFFKNYNLLHWNGSQSIFVLDEDLENPSSLNIQIENESTIKELLKINEEIPELNYFFTQANL